MAAATNDDHYKMLKKILNTSYNNHVTSLELGEYEEIVRREGSNDKLFVDITEEQIELDKALIWEDFKLLDGLTEDDKLMEYKRRTREKLSEIYI
jgi:hypothetical protein